MGGGGKLWGHCIFPAHRCRLQGGGGSTETRLWQGLLGGLSCGAKPANHRAFSSDESREGWLSLVLARLPAVLGFGGARVCDWCGEAVSPWPTGSRGGGGGDSCWTTNYGDVARNAAVGFVFGPRVGCGRAPIVLGGPPHPWYGDV